MRNLPYCRINSECGANFLAKRGASQETQLSPPSLNYFVQTTSQNRDNTLEEYEPLVRYS